MLRDIPPEDKEPTQAPRTGQVRESWLTSNGNYFGCCSEQNSGLSPPIRTYRYSESQSEDVLLAASGCGSNHPDEADGCL